jgi:hypothetical protein
MDDTHFMNNFNSSTGPLAILVQFLKNPSKFTPTIPRDKINQHIFAYIFFGIAVSGFLNTILALIFSKQYESILGLSDKFSMLPLPVLAFLLLIYAPFVEELVFRGPLAKGSMIVKRVWLFLITFGFSLSALLFVVHRLTTFNLDFANFALLATLGAGSFAMIIAILLPIQLMFKPKVFNTLMYLQAIAFGLIHIGNYTFSYSALYIFIPFLICNQLYMGFVNGYLSSKYVITKSILSHFINNLFAFSFVVITYPKIDSTTAYIFGGIATVLFITGFYYFLTLNFNFTKKTVESSGLVTN